jgi:polyisoprenoid-binding protein YceI
MKKLVLAMAVLGLFQSQPAQAAQSYKLDPMHTNIVFHISHFGFSNPSGKFPNAEGELVLDEKSPVNSRVSVTIPVSHLITGIPKLDEHLKTPDFFDVATYPVATFKSRRVILTGKDTALVKGDLTLHGITKPVTLKVKLNKIGENMFKKQTAGFTATTTLKRSDFGMKTYLPGLGDEVRLEIDSEANLAE